LWDPPATALPTASALASATESARCGRLTVDEAAGRVELLPGSALDLRSFARGWAIDRAADLLRGLGASDFEVRIGALVRASGAGPGGKGWPYALPPFANVADPLGTLLLRDQAVAVADPSLGQVRIAGESFSRYVDLRSGRPSAGVAGVVVVTELAVDAEALATAMAVFGANAGQLRMGTLKPRPAVLWILGSPETGAPVLATANWSAVKKQ
jgi:thiamine biosynthesis lipoprotein